MIASGVAMKFNIPIWMDKKGGEVKEINAKGMKVSTQLHHPDMCIVMDKVGCNNNMAKDGHVNGFCFVVAKNDEAKQKASKKRKTLNVFGSYFTYWRTPYMCGNY
jgi:hypothetical protein